MYLLYFIIFILIKYLKNLYLIKSKKFYINKFLKKSDILII